MNPVVRRLIGRWYDPRVTRDREERTRAATAAAVALRIYSAEVGRRVKLLDENTSLLRQSAAHAGRRLSGDR